MYCPYCNSYNIKVEDSKSKSKRSNYRRRRYKCLSCEKKFSTLEVPATFRGLKIVNIGGDMTAILFPNVTSPNLKGEKI